MLCEHSSVYLYTAGLKYIIINLKRPKKYLLTIKLYLSPLYIKCLNPCTMDIELCHLKKRHSNRITMHLVYLQWLWKYRRKYTILYIFSMWSLCHYPETRTPYRGVMDFIILVEGFINIKIIHSVYLKYIVE